MNDMNERFRRGWVIAKYVARGVAARFWRVFDAVWDFVAREWAILAGEGRLYLGIALTLAGVMNFDAGRFCDGNTLDYIACTRPVVYYEYPWWAIALAILGALLLAGWWRNRNS